MRNRLFEENEKIIKTLLFQIKELHRIFDNIYDANWDYIRNCFYPTLKHDYSYVIYDKETKTYMLMNLLVDIEEKDNDYAIRLGSELMEVSNQEYSFDGKSFSDTVEEVRVDMERISTDRTITPEEVSIYINTETLIVSAINMLYGMFLQNNIPSDKIVSLLLDEKKFIDESKVIYREYRYNLCVAASTIAKKLNAFITKQGYRFLVDPVVVPTEFDGIFVITTQCSVIWLPDAV